MGPEWRPVLQTSGTVHTKIQKFENKAHYDGPVNPMWLENGV